MPEFLAKTYTCHQGEPTHGHGAALWQAAPAAPTRWKEV